MAATIVKVFPFVSLDVLALDYRFIVYDDGTLWMATGKDDKAQWQVDYNSVNNVMPEIHTTLATVNAALSVDQTTKVIGVAPNTITLKCDLPVNHTQSFHHDPATHMYWVSDQ